MKLDTKHKQLKCEGVGMPQYCEDSGRDSVWLAMAGWLPTSTFHISGHCGRGRRWWTL